MENPAILYSVGGAIILILIFIKAELHTKKQRAIKRNKALKEAAEEEADLKKRLSSLNLNTGLREQIALSKADHLYTRIAEQLNEGHKKFSLYFYSELDVFDEILNILKNRIETENAPVKITNSSTGVGSNYIDIEWVG